MSHPYLFDEFFASGLEESVSPFLTKSSRKWGRNLGLKSACSAALFLAAAFGFSFVSLPLSYMFLMGVYFLSGAPALLAALNDLKNLEINIDVLMTLAAFLAVLIGSGLEGALLLVLFELSHGMESAVSQKAKSAIHNLNHLAPKFAYVLSPEGELYRKAVREVGVGTHLLIKNGEIAALDGRVIEGISSVNLVHLTGESVPVVKKEGDILPAGAQNLEAALVIEVTRTSSDSTIARMIQLIAQAEEAKPRLQRWLDRFGEKYATSIIGLTIAFAIGLPLLFSMPYLGLDGGIYRALAFLIAASPCALIIATPTAYLSAISASARKGILLKGGITLDAIASCKTIAFDKTGTLTTGDLEVASIEPLSKNTTSIETALSIAASLERHVVHPIANAICAFADAKKAPILPLSEVEALAGRGVSAIAEINGDRKKVFIGLPEESFVENTEPQEGQVLAILAIGDTEPKERFLFRFIDQIRKDSAKLLTDLKASHELKTVMLTGDNEKNAQTVGRLLDLSEIHANLRPQDKLEKVAQLSQNDGLAMVGDGINDAPALARATVGISMGRIGSGAAIDASDVVLLNDDLSLISWLFAKAHQTQRIVKQNVTLALSVIALATIPALFGWIPLWAAVILHEGGTVLVGLNSLRLFRDRRGLGSS